MIPLFFGLTAANLLMLTLVFALGLVAVGPEAEPTQWYGVHIALAIAAGLLAAFVHVAIYTYFMATSKWLRAAADKCGLDLEQFVRPALDRKRRVFPIAIGAVVLTMITMFAGAGADSTFVPLWPSEVHLALAAITLPAHGLAAIFEYRMITAQGQLMDDVLARVNPETPQPATS
ncbi:MAG: hypothetical protein R3336_01035 [Phycisphaeraceae bacterium]|nr:hypothetical protein [Phycisphaeraceae bacterium]